MKKAHCGNSTRMKKIDKQTAVIIIIIIILVVFIIHELIIFIEGRRGCNGDYKDVSVR